MSFEIVGAVYDGAGNAYSQDEYEAMIAEQALNAAGLSLADVGAAMPLSFLRRPGAPAAAPAAQGGNLLRQLMANPALGRALRPPALGNMRQALLPAQPGPIDETPLPIDSGAVIAGGATAVISVNSQIIFRPRRLIIGDSLNSFFTVDDLRVGNVPLGAGVGAIPGEAFSPSSVNPNVRKVTANPGVAISITVTNQDAFGHRFRAVFFGEGSQPEGCRV